LSFIIELFLLDAFILTQFTSMTDRQTSAWLRLFTVPKIHYLVHRTFELQRMMSLNETSAPYCLWSSYILCSIGNTIHFTWCWLYPNSVRPSFRIRVGESTPILVMSHVFHKSGCSVCITSLATITFLYSHGLLSSYQVGHSNLIFSLIFVLYHSQGVDVCSVLPINRYLCGS